MRIVFKTVPYPPDRECGTIRGPYNTQLSKTLKVKRCVITSFFWYFRPPVRIGWTNPLMATLTRHALTVAPAAPVGRPRSTTLSKFAGTERISFPGYETGALRRASRVTRFCFQLQRGRRQSAHHRSFSLWNGKMSYIMNTILRINCFHLSPPFLGGFRKNQLLNRSEEAYVWAYALTSLWAPG